MLHIKGEIKPGDRLVTRVGTKIDNLKRLASMFAGEYQATHSNLPHGDAQTELLRLSPSITANMCNELPESTDELENQMEDCGFLLVRNGFPLDEDKIVQLMGGSENLIDYGHGLNARAKVPSSIFSYVTPWSEELDILPHNELSHHIEFPRYVCFMCKQPAQYGGETTIYDCEKAFASLSPTSQQAALEKSIIFVRKHVGRRNHKKYSSCWQDISAKTGQEAMGHWLKLGYHCSLSYEHEDGELVEVLETQMKRPLAYWYKGKPCLHASIVGAASYWYQQVPGKQAPQMQVMWEGGEALIEAQFREMEKAIKSARIFYCAQWQTHDLLILDNLRISHGRLPFLGKRLVGLLMGGKAHFEAKSGRWIGQHS
ncbi:MAG: TauD/TfdA family dioxygenase [Symploca sp. SIO2B6]|nr:TauD/TfdA family dioxygenase [Symploca sp. SIO2B6]